MDFQIPTIKKPNEKDIIERFQFKELDKIEGGPKYKSLTRARKQSTRNARKIPSIFGGGTTGHAGMVVRPTIFEKRTGCIPWEVPASKGNTQTIIFHAVDAWSNLGRQATDLQKL